MAADPYNLGLGTTATNPYLSTPGQTNPNLQSIIDMSSRDLVNNYNATTQPAFNAAMVRSGSFGNSGIDAANARAQSQLQQNLGDTSAKLRFQDYNNQQQMYQWQQQQDAANGQFNLGFGRALYNDAFGQQQQNLQTGIGLLGTLAGYNQNDLQTGTTVRNAPLDYLQQFTNLGSTIGRGGQTQTTTQQGGGGNPLVGAIGGAQLGNSWWNRGSSQPISQPNQNAFDSWGASSNWFGTGNQ